MKSDEEIAQVTGTLAGTYHPRPCNLWMGFVEKQKLDFGMHFNTRPGII
jgi:hypothetical protein